MKGGEDCDQNGEDMFCGVFWLCVSTKFCLRKHNKKWVFVSAV